MVLPDHRGLVCLAGSSRGEEGRSKALASIIHSRPGAEGWEGHHRPCPHSGSQLLPIEIS